MDSTKRARKGGSGKAVSTGVVGDFVWRRTLSTVVATATMRRLAEAEVLSVQGSSGCGIFHTLRHSASLEP